MGELEYTKKPYITGPDSTALQTVDIWQPKSEIVARDEKLWLIYIHGGAWRDPWVQSKNGFEPAVMDIWKSSIRESIAGFASINYRLSPYPSHPDNPSSPNDPARNVHHPSHLQDVGHALCYLEREYQIANRYLLIGHSAGATMAFQLHNQYFPKKALPIPTGVLGVSGIYHFKAFVEAHSHIPEYQEMMDNAFPNKTQWEEASPYTNRSPGSAIWEHAKAVIISHSADDGLVEMGQSTAILERARTILHCKDKVHFLELSGKHDDVWFSGYLLADLITRALKILENSS